MLQDNQVTPQPQLADRCKDPQSLHLEQSLMKRDNQAHPALSQYCCKDPHCSRQYHCTCLLLSSSGSTLLCSPKDLSCLRALHEQPSPCSPFSEYPCSIRHPHIQGLLECQCSSCVGGLAQDKLCNRIDNLWLFRAPCAHRAPFQRKIQALQEPICHPLRRIFLHS